MKKANNTINYTITIEDNEMMKNKISALTKKAIIRKDEKMFFNNSKEYYKRHKK